MGKYSVNPLTLRSGKINGYLMGGNQPCLEWTCQDTISERTKNNKRTPRRRLPPRPFIMNSKVRFLDLIEHLHFIYRTHHIRQSSEFHALWDMKDNCDYFYLLLKRLQKKQELRLEPNQTYIKILRPTKTQKYIILGDLHGSFHTFFRLLLRWHQMKILDLATFKLEPNHNILFLGDVIDRGLYSMEILLVIGLLLDRNPSQVIYNRGNHEETDINARDGFLHELLLKTKSESQAIKIHETYNALLKMFPSAIYIRCPDGSNVYLAHGVFSKYHNYTPFLKTTGHVYIIPDETMNLPYSDKMRLTGTFTRWNDLALPSCCMNRGFATETCLYPTDVQKVCRTMHITFILHGHQDGRTNTFFYSTEFNPTNSNYLAPGTNIANSLKAKLLIIKS